ncbi:MAG TPA: metallophosphoesterase [Gaiellaceae bacterium]|nr:metallophosphoesterase [Gaiellaceae bacterium]
MRLYFATDVHGSETCWRKFLNAGAHYKADVLVLGGDMTGKALVPVIDDGGGRWHATLLENRRDMTTEDEVLAFEDAVIRRGYYPFRTDVEHLRELESEESRWHALFHEKMLETVEKWMQMADERLGGTGIRIFCCPGNDDQFEVDEVIENAKTVELAEGRVVDVDGFQMASTGWANRTPWDTYREEDEPDLKARLDKVIAQVTAPKERTVFSFHCPPYHSGLDDAPELTADMDLKDAGRAIKPVGSTAVRAAIEEYEPALSLHGHIHEARGNTRIGRTLCINPGSSYEQGDLLGAVIDLDGKKKVKRFLLTSG